MNPRVAYFTMEIGINPSIPTYAGGLGVLAGDTLKAAADLGFPIVGVTLLHRKGYFRQHLDSRGNQTEAPYEWAPQDVLEPLPAKISIEIEGRKVRVGVWCFTIRGPGKGSVPVYFLDTDLPENSAWDRSLCGVLYATDLRYRLCQEMALGMGGVAMLRALGHDRLQFFHMNEGHSALLTLALLEERLAGPHYTSVPESHVESVRRQCVFTTHTPVPAGHDQFPLDLVTQVLGRVRTDALTAHGWSTPREMASHHAQLGSPGTAPSMAGDGRALNMTNLALTFSDYVNGVAMRHGEVSRDMFPSYPIDSITNGIHAATWASPSFAALFDRHIPAWRGDNSYLRYAIRIPPEEIRKSHAASKHALFDEIQRRTNVRLHPDTLTLGFARRATAYKRADLLFSDLDRLRSIAGKAGRLQAVFAGKAHPNDEPGKILIRRIFEASAVLGESLPVVYLENYDMALAQILCAGVDIWLNTPQQPLEASGTSGMKAAINGIPSLSVLDGWWIEGHVEGVTGWSIGGHWRQNNHHTDEARSLYDKLEQVILPMYYHRPDEFDRLRQSTIVVNGSFFNAHRMMNQYIRNAYQE